MTTLTSQQELFAQTVASGESQSDAYRRAYKVRANTKQESIHQAASKLMSDLNIISRVDELRKPIIEKVGLTLEAHLARLEHLSKKAEEAENYGPAVTAETNRGKAAGLYTEKVAVTGAVSIIASALDARL